MLEWGLTPFPGGIAESGLTPRWHSDMADLRSWVSDCEYSSFSGNVGIGFAHPRGVIPSVERRATYFNFSAKKRVMATAERIRFGVFRQP